jgi:hypothetical protein
MRERGNPTAHRATETVFSANAGLVRRHRLSFGNRIFKRWPTLEPLQKARPATVRSFFTQHKRRSQELIEQRLEAIRRAVPAVRDRAPIRAASRDDQGPCGTDRDPAGSIANFDRQIAQAVATHLDFAIFDSFPGAGPGAGAPPSGRVRVAKRPLSERHRFADVQRNCSRYRTQRQVRMGSRTLGLSALSPPDVSRMGGSLVFATGLALSIATSAIAGTTTTPPFGPSPSNGSESLFVAGKTAFSMRTLATSKASAVVPRR